MQTRFNYVSSGLFTLPNGLDYSGYINVDDSGNVYSGKYFDDNSILLNSVSKYSTDYYKSGYYKDRHIYDELSLPYSIDRILIQHNELVNFGTINKKFEYLHYNLMYMYSRMFMGSTDVPVDYNVNTLCNLIGTNDFKWVEKNDPNIEIYGFKQLTTNSILSAYSEFDNLKRFVVIPFEDGTGVGILGITNTHLIGLTSLISEDGKMSGGNFTLYTDVIDNYSQETCKNLEDITFDGRYLYVTDSEINGGGQIFKYDVTSYYTNDSVFEGKRFLVEPLGGSGDSNRKNKFNGCTVINSFSDELWVYDSGNNVIKVFDTNFVWKKNIKIPNTGKYTIIDIRYRKLNNKTYVLYEETTSSDSVFGMFEYNSDYTLNQQYKFEDILQVNSDKRFNRMAISEQDSNVFYLVTENTIYKKFFSKPEKTFAIFDRNNFFSKDSFIWNYIDLSFDNIPEERTWNYSEFYNLTLKIKDIFVLGSDKNNKDDLYFMGDSFISHVNEKTEYLSLLRDENVNYYNFDRIKLDKIEYNQGFVLNKEIYKLLSDITQIKNNLKGKFYAEYNEYGDIIYKDYIYLLDEQINTLNVEIDYNTYINDNELVEPNVLNRVLRKIYEFQIKMLELTNAKLKNIKTYVDLVAGSNIYPID
jgi:hypothetical protein